ncbi:hypothetical protein VE03_03883 [Pseudogymnoascus sp. 23342-1-I1]|nr:hypothetical protein VE03_03883 [Pseudogymnoascus sp. 23342-1-I1]
MKKEDIARLVIGLSKEEFKSIELHLAFLDKYLTLRSYIDGYTLSQADSTLWVVIGGNKVAYALLKKVTFVNVSRWFTFVEQSHPELQEEFVAKDDAAKAKRAAQSRAGASYNIALQDAEMGKVVTRFPPEPSYWIPSHRHANAALLNDYFAHDLYKGTLLFRFDDTNSTKEKQEFQDSITEDLDILGIKPDKTSYTSDHFQTLYEYCVRMIKEGNAYADDTDQKTTRNERMTGQASARRNRTVDENMTIFEGMIAGTEVQNCIRAKMSVDNPNKAMRDPVIYRCNHTPHHRPGTLWKAYPTYDFACPLVDSLEGVTHALRTTEFAVRNPQYQWFLNCFNLRKVHIWDFARMNFKRTFLSKRKLTKLVDAGRVRGWDDPRMPTIRGVLRRGMTIAALRDFILKQGPSRNVTLMDWTIFWNINKKEIDPIAPRHTAVDQKQTVVATIIKGGPEQAYTEERPRHNKNSTLGMKKEDAKIFEQDEEITLMAWGNAIIRKINRSSPNQDSPVVDIELELHLEGDVKKTEKKITWLSTEGPSLIPVELVDFDYLLTKDKLKDDDNWEDFLTEQTEFRSAAFCDANLAACKAGDIIQLERKGCFRVDEPYKDGNAAVLFSIPTGKTG